jgi:hypothetical protein
MYKDKCKFGYYWLGLVRLVPSEGTQIGMIFFDISLQIFQTRNHCLWHLPSLRAQILNDFLKIFFIFSKHWIIVCTNSKMQTEINSHRV